ncbi:MAG: EF-P lysine aminoacylase EpmA [Gammaproteobacteria bacterium]|jgi:lysyl-tRNA synthetase class 2
MTSGTHDQRWRPQAGFDVLRLRARVFQGIREFFRQRGVWEVDTPVLSAAAVTDPSIDSFITHYEGHGDVTPQRYLMTSPEFHMKRLLAAGSGSIYQLCHVFRQAEMGADHNPEFTLLEWYRVGMHYRELMKEVAQLVRVLVKEELRETQYLSYQDAFLRYAEIDPLTAATEALFQKAQQSGLSVSAFDPADRDVYLDVLMSHQVQPQLGIDRLTFIYEYPASQCALARIAPDNPNVAERFELFLQGKELANGYQELTDAGEQQQRMQRDSQERVRRGSPSVTADQQLIDALAAGLPDCSGVAMGIDRLIQFLAHKANIKDVLAFPFERA